MILLSKWEQTVISLGCRACHSNFLQLVRCDCEYRNKNSNLAVTCASLEIEKLSVHKWFCILHSCKPRYRTAKLKQLKIPSRLKVISLVRYLSSHFQSNQKEAISLQLTLENILATHLELPFHSQSWRAVKRLCAIETMLGICLSTITRHVQFA